MTATQVNSKRQGRSARGQSLGNFLVALIVITLLAGATGALDRVYFSQSAAGIVQNKGAAMDQQAHSGSQVFDLPPIVTNLSAPKDTWVRLETSMIVDPKIVQHPEALGGQIADDLLGYLRTVTLPEIQGPIGLENLRQDINDRASIRSKGTVKELIIRTLVVQ